ncbi:MAG: hypothetical protein E7571_05080 [Ruminococcaceae bacterium]|nr:hypothetical protein [Oscillospiraceae bacterium]
MNEKQIAKRYLLSLLLLYAAGAILLTAFIFALSSRQSTAMFKTNHIIMLGMLLPLVPCSSYAGFCNAFLKVDELTKKQMILIVALFPLFIAAVTLYGAVVLVPSVVRYAVRLCRKEE